MTETIQQGLREVFSQLSPDDLQQLRSLTFVSTRGGNQTASAVTMLLDDELLKRSTWYVRPCAGCSA